MRNQTDCMKAYGVVLMTASLAPVGRGGTALALAVSGSAMRQGSQTLGTLRGSCSRPPLWCWPKCFPGGSRSVPAADIRDFQARSWPAPVRLQPVVRLPLRSEIACLRGEACC